MKKINILTVLVVMISLHSCKKYDELGNEIIFEELYKAHWLQGKWQTEDSLGVLTETWQPLDDSTYTGETLYIKDEKDTIHFETMQLMQDGDLLVYTSTVKGENGNQPVSYRMVEDSDSLLVFENKKHDYPRTIRYQKENDSTLEIVILGKQNKKNTGDSYLLKKVKPEETKKQ